MAPESQIILITGANRGIGYAIVQATALRYPQHTYILGVRSTSSGQTAITSSRALGVISKLDVLELDVTSNSSILAAKDYISKTYGRLDGTFLNPFKTFEKVLIVDYSTGKQCGNSITTQRRRPRLSKRKLQYHLQHKYNLHRHPNYLSPPPPPLQFHREWESNQPFIRPRQYLSLC